jgi:hypothetical protein
MCSESIETKRERALALAYSQLSREMVTALYTDPLAEIDMPIYGRRMRCVDVVGDYCQDDPHGWLHSVLSLLMRCAEDDGNPVNPTARGLVSSIAHLYADENAGSRVVADEGFCDES